MAKGKKVDLNPTIRDFVYLDWERIRSIAAQLFKGIPTEATKGKESQASADGGIEGGIINVIKGQVGVDYRYIRSENETRSFHHHIYSLVEDQLQNDKKIIRINEEFDFDDWNREFFSDGQFVQIIGNVRLIDYEWLSTMMEGLPKMMKIASYYEKMDLKNRLKEALDNNSISSQEYSSKLKQLEKDHQQQSSEIKELKLDDLTHLVKQLFGKVIRIKIIPSKDDSSKIFAGFAELSKFYDSTISLSQKYGYESSKNWVTVGQINTYSSEEPDLVPIGNDLEDSFEQVAFAVNDIVKIASAVKFPVISITPISIYRCC